MHSNYQVEGDTKITDDVLCAIAALKTLDINGVVGMSSNLVDGLTNLLGFKSMSQGVKLIREEGKLLAFNIYIIVKYGYRIPDIALKVQEKIKSSIEELTDYKVTGVDVFIQGIIFDEELENLTSK